MTGTPNSKRCQGERGWRDSQQMERTCGNSEGTRGGDKMERCESNAAATWHVFPQLTPLVPLCSPNKFYIVWNMNSCKNNCCIIVFLMLFLILNVHLSVHITIIFPARALLFSLYLLIACRNRAWSALQTGRPTLFNGMCLCGHGRRVKMLNKAMSR